MTNQVRGTRAWFSLLRAIGWCACLSSFSGNQVSFFLTLNILALWTFCNHGQSNYTHICRRLAWKIIYLQYSKHYFHIEGISNYKWHMTIVALPFSQHLFVVSLANLKTQIVKCLLTLGNAFLLNCGGHDPIFVCKNYILSYGRKCLKLAVLNVMFAHIMDHLSLVPIPRLSFEEQILTDRKYLSYGILTYSPEKSACVEFNYIL